MRNYRSKQRLFPFLAPLVAAALIGCERHATAAKAPEKPREAVSVTVGPVAVRSVQRSIEALGTLFGDEEVTISAKIPNRVLAIYKDVGDRAAPGETIAELEKTDFELAVRQKDLAMREVLAKLNLAELPPPGFDVLQVPTVQRAKIQADNAEAKYQRGKQLHESKPPLLSDQDFADLQTAAAVARSNYDVELLGARATLAEAHSRKAELDQSRQRLDDMTIRAPQRKAAAGGVAATQKADDPDSYIIAARSISVGVYLMEGNPLFKLVDDDPIKFRALVPERHLAEVAVGQKVAVRVEAYPQEFVGRVDRINPQVDAQSRTFQAEIVVPNPKRLLKTGSFARARIQTRMEEGVILVPPSVVQSFAGVSKVYVARDGKAVEVLVAPGEAHGELVEIPKGLKPGDLIISSNFAKLANGVKVVVVEK